MNVTSVREVSLLSTAQQNNDLAQKKHEKHIKSTKSINSFSKEAFLVDVINTFQNFGFNLVDNLNANSSSSLGNSNILTDEKLSSSSLSLTNALNNFVFSLQSSLDQASQTGSSESTTEQNGFNGFSNDLLLLSLLTNNSLAKNSIFLSNPLLESNFKSLIDILAPRSPGVATLPNLSDFFNMMLNNLQTISNDQNNVGTSISISV